MKSKNVIPGILLCLILSAGFWYERGLAEGKKEIAPARIGVVSIREVLETNNKNQEWEAKMTTEAEKIGGALQKLAKEIEAMKADINTRLPGSSDYLDLMRQALEKQALLEAKEKFYQQEFSLKQQQRTEDMYKQVLDAISRVAIDKGLDMVLAKEDYQFPSSSMEDLIRTLRTSKVLYHAKEMDITNEVLAIINN